MSMFSDDPGFGAKPRQGIPTSNRRGLFSDDPGFEYNTPKPRQAEPAQRPAPETKESDEGFWTKAGRANLGVVESGIGRLVEYLPETFSEAASSVADILSAAGTSPQQAAAAREEARKGNTAGAALRRAAEPTVRQVGEAYRPYVQPVTTALVEEGKRQQALAGPGTFRAPSQGAGFGETAGYMFEQGVRNAAPAAIGLGAGLLTRSPRAAQAVMGGLSYGATLDEVLASQKERGFQDLPLAIRASMASAALDTISGGEAKVAEAIASGAGKRLFGQGVKEFGKDMLKIGAEEAGTEAVQTAIERTGARKDLFSREAMGEYIDSAAGGFGGGIVMGGGVRLLTGNRKAAENKPSTENAGSDLLNTEGGTQAPATPPAATPSFVVQDADGNATVNMDTIRENPRMALDELGQLYSRDNIITSLAGETEADDFTKSLGARLHRAINSPNAKSIPNLVRNLKRDIDADMHGEEVAAQRAPLVAKAALMLGDYVALRDEAMAADERATNPALVAETAAQNNANELARVQAVRQQEQAQLAAEQARIDAERKMQLDNAAKEVEGIHRKGFLEAVAKDPKTRDPVARFTALLKRNGFNPEITAQEQIELTKAAVGAEQRLAAEAAQMDMTVAEYKQKLAEDDMRQQQAESGTASMEAQIREAGSRAPTASMTPKPAPMPAGKTNRTTPENFQLEMQRELTDADIEAQQKAAARRQAKEDRALAKSNERAERRAAKQGEMFTPTGKVRKATAAAAAKAPAPVAAPAPKVTVSTKLKEKARAAKEGQKPKGSVSERQRVDEKRQAAEAGRSNRLEQIKAIAEKRKKVKPKTPAQKLAEAKKREAAAKAEQEARIAESKAKQETVEVPNLEGVELYAYQNVSGQIDTARDMGEITPQQSVQLKSMIAMRVEPAVIQQAVKDATARNKSKAKTTGAKGERLKESTRAERATMTDELQRELERLGLNKVGLGVVADLIETAQGKAEGTYQAGSVAEVRSGFRALINVVFNDFTKALETLHHEAIHYMRDANLITEDEWATLTAIVKADKNLMTHIRDNWKGLSEESLIEEAVAEKFREWMRTQKAIAPGIRGVFQRMRNFFNTVRLGFNKPAFAEAKAIFQSINAGERNDKNVTSLRSDTLKNGALKLSPANREERQSAASGSIIGGTEVDIDTFRGRTLNDLLDHIASNRNGDFNAFDTRLADRLNQLVGQLQEAGADINLHILQQGDKSPSAIAVGSARGLVDTDLKTRKVDVYLRSPKLGRAGNTTETILHEALHAISSGVILAVRNGRGTPEMVQFVNDLNSLRNKVINHFNGRVKKLGKAGLTEFELAMYENRTNAFKNMDEFLAWSMTNDLAKEYLTSIEVGPRKSVFSQFVDAFRSLLGISPNDTSALAHFIDVVNPLFELTAEDYKTTFVQKVEGSGEKEVSSQRQEERARGKGALKPDTDFHSKIDYYPDGLRTVDLGKNPDWVNSEWHHVTDSKFSANNNLPNQVIEVYRHNRNGQNIIRVSVSRKSIDATFGDRGNHFAVSAYIRDGVVTDGDGLISMLNEVAEQLASQPQRASEKGVQQQVKDFIDSQLPKYATTAPDGVAPASTGLSLSPKTFSMPDNAATRSKVSDAITKISEGNGPSHIQIDLNQGTKVLSGGDLPAKFEAPARPASQTAPAPTPQPASAPASKAAPASTPAPKSTPSASEAKTAAKAEEVNQKIETRLENKNVPPSVGDQTGFLARKFNEVFDKFARKAMTHTLIEAAEKAGLPSAGVYQDIELDKARVRYKIEQRISKVLETFDSLPANLREVGGAVNTLLQDSTMSGKWAFKPSWLKEGSYEVDPELQKRFDALPAEGKLFVREVFQENNDLRQQLMDTVDAAIDEPYERLIQEAEAANDKKQVADLKREREGLRAQKTLMFRVDPTKPYASLRRQGKFAVSAKSEEYVAAQEAKDNKLIQELQSAPEHNYFNKFETEAEAKAEAKRLKDLGLYSSVIATTDDTVVNEIAGGRETFQAFQRIFKALEARDGLSEQAKRTLQSVITDLHVMSMSNASARKSEIKRKNVYGGDLDMVRNFATQSRAMAYHIASLKNNDMLMEAVNGMNKEVRSAPDPMEASKFRDEILLRHMSSLRASPNSLVETMKRLTAIYKIAFSPSFYIQNFTQVPMMAGPELAARGGLTKAVKLINGGMEEVAKAWKDTKWTESLNIDELPADVRDVVQRLADISLIDVGLDADLGNMQSLRGRAGEKWGQTGESLDKAMQVGVAATNVAQDLTRKQESINRTVTAIAAYRLELERTGNRQKAINYATDLVRNTMGTYDGFNAPRYMQGAGGIPFQFRKFQLMQITLLMRHIQNGFTDPNITPEERAIARQALKYQLGTAALMGGIRSLPGAALLIWLYNTFFGDDDEPAEADNQIRKAVGDETVADLLIYGVPSLADINLSGMLGFGNTFSILPYTKLELTKEGVAKAAFDLAGAGPATLRDIGIAMKQTYDGLMEGREDYYRGLEKMLPKGFTNAVTAYREATEGVTNYKDDKLISKEDVSYFDTAKTLLGVQSVKTSERFRKQEAEKVLDQFFKDKTSKLKRQYVQAVDNNQPKRREDIKAEWRTMQDAREKQGKKRQPISILLKAKAEQRQQEEMTVGGIQYRAKDKRFREAQAEEE